MFCLQCGTENSTDSKFCKECGTRVNSESPVPASGKPRLAPQIAQELGAEEHENPQLRRLIEMAFWHNQTGNIPAAILACEAALIIEPDSATALSLLGCLYERQGDVQKAIYAFERVLELNPDSEADQEKLAALKRGEFLRPVVQPIRYRWVPPAMVGLVQDSKLVRIAAAAAAGLALFAVGLAALRPRDQAQATSPSPAAPLTTATVPRAEPAAQPSAVALSAQTTPQVGAYGVVPAVNTPIYTASPRPTQTVAPSAGYGDPAMAQQRPENTAIAPPIDRTRKTRVYSRGLPPLTVAATANPDTPALDAVRPISPDGAQFQRTVQVSRGAVMPEHMVVVGGARSSSAADASDPATDPNSALAPSGPPPPATRISIHFHNAGAVAGDAGTVPTDGFAGASGSRPSHAAALQQRALAQQQQGNYTGAARAYRGAIAAYQQQIAAGQAVDEARRGIDACQTGLQICQQSQ